MTLQQRFGGQCYVPRPDSPVLVNRHDRARPGRVPTFAFSHVVQAGNSRNWRVFDRRQVDACWGDEWGRLFRLLGATFAARSRQEAERQEEACFSDLAHRFVYRVLLLIA